MLTILGCVVLALACALLFLAIVAPGGVSRSMLAFWGFWAAVSVVDAVVAHGLGGRVVWALSAACVASAMALEWRAMPDRPDSPLPERENQR